MMINTSTHENIYMDKIRIGYFWLLNIYCDYLLSWAYIGIPIAKWITYLYILTTLNSISCYLIVSRKKQENFCLMELFWINKKLCTWFNDNVSLTVTLIFELCVNINWTEKCENGWRRQIVTMCKQTSK